MIFLEIDPRVTVCQLNSYSASKFSSALTLGGGTSEVAAAAHNIFIKLGHAKVHYIIVIPVIPGLKNLQKCF